MFLGIYNVYVEDFMIRDVKYIWYNMSYRDLKKVLRENKVLRMFPLVDKPGQLKCLIQMSMG
jgi:chloride channel 2